MVAQGLAWIDMAKEAGGLHQLGEVIFKSEPCERCHAAVRLNHESQESNEGTVPAKPVEPLRFSATNTAHVRLPLLPTTGFAMSFPIAHSDRALASLGYPPALPPPRCTSVAS